jgi:nucleoside-diphosphate-sugar epimerase
LEESWRGGVRCFVYGSSVGVWGTTPRQVPPDVRTEYVPDTLYHASKIEAEKAVRRSREKGLNAIIVRPTITYGAGDAGFPATLVGLVRKKRLILSRPDIRVHLVSVQAVADCLARILRIGETADDLYVVLDREPVTLRQLADGIHRHFHHTPYPPAITMPRAIFAAADGCSGCCTVTSGRSG